VTGFVIDDQTGRPLDKVRVVVWDKLKSRVISEGSTGTSGQFQIDELPLDKSYLVTLTRQNYVETEALLPPAGQDPSRVPIFLRLIRHGVITGQVLDGNGSPVRNARVYLFLAESPVSYGQPLSSAQTDSDGRYRLFGLFPGKYVIGVAGIVDRGKRVFGILISSDSVSVFGDESERNIWMQQYQASDVTGVVHQKSSQNEFVTVELLDSRYSAITLAAQQASPDGRFVFENVLPGTYNVIAHAFGKESSEPEFGREQVSVVGGSMRGVDISLRTGAKASLAFHPGFSGSKSDECTLPATIKLSPIEDFSGAKSLTASVVSGAATVGPLAPILFSIEANSGDCQSAISQIDMRSGNETSVLSIEMIKSASIEGRLEVQGDLAQRGVLLIPYGPVKPDRAVLVQDLGKQGRTFSFDKLSTGGYYVLSQTLDNTDGAWKPSAIENRIELSTGERLELKLSGP